MTFRMLKTARAEQVYPVLASLVALAALIALVQDQPPCQVDRVIEDQMEIRSKLALKM